MKINYNAMAVKIETQRFEKMCNAFYEVADLAMDDDSKSLKVMEWIDSLKNTLQGDTSVNVIDSSQDNQMKNVSGAVNTEQVKITDPVVVSRGEQNRTGTEKPDRTV